MLTAATRWSSSRGSTSTILTCISLIFIFSNGVQSRSVSPFVRKGNNATVTNDSPTLTSSSMTALPTFNVFPGGPPAGPILMPPPPPSNQSSSSVTSTSITSSSTPIYSTTSLSTTTISSFAINSTSSQSLSTSFVAIQRQSTLISPHLLVELHWLLPRWSL